MNKIQYREYLKSDHWQNLRRLKLKRKCQCGICGSNQNIQIHHLQYRNIYDVKTTDLRRLCGRCHTLVHELIKSGKLVVNSRSHHGMWCQTKNAVKYHLKPKPPSKDKMVNLICLFDSTDATHPQSFHLG